MRVAERPYVLLSAAMSVDGYIDDASGERLMPLRRLLIWTGSMRSALAVTRSWSARRPSAATTRRLLVRSPARRSGAARPRADGQPGQGHPDPDRRSRPGVEFLHHRRRRQAGLRRQRGGGQPPGPGWPARRRHRRGAAGRPARPVLADLAARGIGAADGRGRHHRAHPVPRGRGCRRASAGDRAVLRRGRRRRPGSSAPAVPARPRRYPMELAEARPVGDVVLLRYLLGGRAS